MGYFDTLRKTGDWLNLWAELRHEQGVRVGPKIDRIVRQMDKLAKELERTRRSPAMARREPNSLDEIREARPAGPRLLWSRFDPKAYADRVEGAWLARAAGCTLGAPVEGWPVASMEELAAYAGAKMPPTDYWPLVANPQRMRYNLSRTADYARPNLKHVPVDDDLTYTLLGLLILEDYGPGFTIEEVGKAWLKYLPMACTAEHVTLENLKKGVSWRLAGQTGNPFMEWIGADIRSDPWGYAAPGWPEMAAELAWRDAILSHRYNGIYGEMYFSAVIAAAFAVDDPLEACRIGLTEIPRKCRLAADVAWALKQAPKVKDYHHGRALVDARFAGMSHVHTNNNAALVIFGLALGGRDVTKVIGNTVAMGMDNDCTGATAGSIVGAAVGKKGVPARWTKPFRGKVRTYLNGHEWFTIPDIVRRFGTVAKAVWNTGGCCCGCES